MISLFNHFFSYSYGKEVVTALTLTLFINGITKVVMNQRKYDRLLAHNTATRIPLGPVEVSTALSEEELSSIAAAYDEEGPEGKFIKGRHGFTHYVVDPSIEGSGSSKGMIILAHGLGSCLKMYRPLAQHLVKAGYTVLRYDYFGHGYSKYTNGKDMWVQYTPDMFVDQLEDLLDHVCQKENNIGFVGHSTGGIVGTYALDRWGSVGCKNRNLIPKVVMLNPAFWATKPFLARLSDKIPGLMRNLFRKFPALSFLIQDAYMEAGEIGFGRNPTSKEVIYKEEAKSWAAMNSRLFGRVKGVAMHPFLAAGILGITGSSLREDLLPGHREVFVRICEQACAKGTDILFLWGNLDAIVPYRTHYEKVRGWAEDYKSLSFVTLQKIGHEALYENSEVAAYAIIRFLQN